VLPFVLCHLVERLDSRKNPGVVPGGVQAADGGGGLVDQVRTDSAFETSALTSNPRPPSASSRSMVTAAWSSSDDNGGSLPRKGEGDRTAYSGGATGD
jgi:hypothetical protein